MHFASNSEAETETFSKAWYDHKEELQRQREQAMGLTADLRLLQLHGLHDKTS